METILSRLTTDSGSNYDHFWYIVCIQTMHPMLSHGLGVTLVYKTKRAECDNWPTGCSLYRTKIKLRNKFDKHTKTKRRV